MDGQATRKANIEAIRLTAGNPYKESIREQKVSRITSPECRKFEVCCHAGNAGTLEVGSDSVSVRIAQRVRNEGEGEFWGSLLVECKEQDDGSLAVEVVIFHPNWDEPLRIASIQSKLSEKNATEPVIRCDFEQKPL